MDDWIVVQVTRDRALRAELRRHTGPAFRRLAAADTVRVRGRASVGQDSVPRIEALVGGLEVMLEVRFLACAPEEAGALGITAVNTRLAHSGQPTRHTRSQPSA